ncbi:MAG: biopolymer transporter ExbD [Rhodothermales bacterium]|nr:biopolymer transporter ExbD [Rhodothermales bacterium]
MSVDFSTERKPMTAYSLAGLADIVLLLLIFFLLTSSFIPQFGIQVNLPRTETSAPTSGQHVQVSITSNGTFYVEQRQVSREQLLGAIQDASVNKTALVLRADERSQIRDFAEVASIARALNMRVLMATDRLTQRP